VRVDGGCEGWDIGWSRKKKGKTRTLENHKGCGTHTYPPPAEERRPHPPTAWPVGEAKDAEGQLALRRDKAGRASRPDRALRLGARS